VADGFHPPLEEYLEAVHALGEEGVPIIQARLAQRLGHSRPTVSEMVRRLRDEGYVSSSGRTISLTDKGRGRAESVVRKHRLAERLLTDIIGLDWHLAHMEAGRWEHVISDEVEARLVELLGHPDTCPHGNPIPGADRSRRPTQIALAEARPGDRVRLERMTEQVEIDAESLAYLGSHGFIPGVQAEIRDRAPDGTVTLLLGSDTLALGPIICRQLFVSAA
jgi:DtxR family transcriptional regulator, iron-dependent repressor